MSEQSAIERCPLVLFCGAKRGYLVLKAMLERGEWVAGVFGLIEEPHEHVRYAECIESLAKSAGVPIWLRKRLLPEDEDMILNTLRPDLIFAIGWRTMISERITEFPLRGSYGIHDSLLPKLRGFAPLNWAILLGHEEAGVSLQRLAPEVDAGDLVGQVIVPIAPDDDAHDLHERVAQATTDLVLNHLDALKAGTARLTPQLNALATFTCSRTPEDGWIDWARSTGEIHRLVRALTYPYPGAFTYYKGQKLFVWSAKPIVHPPVYEGRIPGRVIRLRPHEGVEVLTGDGVLLVQEVQFEEGERTTADQLIRSVRVRLGLSMVELEARLRRLENLMAL